MARAFHILPFVLASRQSVSAECLPMRAGSRQLQDDDDLTWLSKKKRFRSDTLSLAVSSPVFMDLLASLPMKRRFWTAHPEHDKDGFWELEVNGTWKRLEELHEGYEDEQYVKTYRMQRIVFNQLYERYGAGFEKTHTRLRQAIPGKKRFAILLHWLRNGGNFQSLAELYRVGRSTVHTIVHEGVSAMVGSNVVSDVIKFPVGTELEQVMSDFESLCFLPQCIGAVDGTFMKILKPSHYGDAYYCYKGYTAITLLGCVDARGIFTNINVGQPGSVGDAYTYNHSRLEIKLRNGQWGSVPLKMYAGEEVGGYIVGDSAFSLSAKLMKCFDETNVLPRQRSFNHCVIRTRRVVEQAFGRLKGRWHVLSNNFISDPQFASDVALLCCALHNVCERSNCPCEESWMPSANTGPEGHHHAPCAAGVAGNLQALKMRDALSHYVHSFM